MLGLNYLEVTTIRVLMIIVLLADSTIIHRSVATDIQCILESDCIAIPLTGEWQVTNNNRSLNFTGTVPGQIHLDLLKAGLITEPYYGYNDDNLKWIALEPKWTYTKHIALSDDMLQAYKSFIMWFDGIDTFAKVYLSNTKFGKEQLVLETSNQHRKYEVDVKRYLAPGHNSLILEFFSAALVSQQLAKEYPYSVNQQFTYFNDSFRNFVRKSQSDFGWDWGPAFLPIGIWKNLGLIGFNEAILKEFMPIVYWNETINIFQVELTTVLHSLTSRTDLSITVSVASSAITSNRINCIADMDCTTNIMLPVPATEVSLWWPVGYGKQIMYPIFLTVNMRNYTSRKIHKYIGFRRVKLMQENIKNETDGLTFYFSINDIPVSIRGSNWIPPDAFTGRVTDQTLDRLLKSAVVSNQNMLRVWGGGIYQSDQFYSKCDAMGILVWQEFMFACSLYPRDVAFLSNVENEIENQVKRLAHHPSLVLWSGNNENQDIALKEGTSSIVDYTALYDDVIRKTLYKFDLSRPYWPSSPSNGDLVVDLNRKLFIQRWGNAQNSNYGDIHYYDYISDCTDVSNYPKPRFTSEYGFQSYPSLHSLLPIITDISDLDNQSPLMLHRQHHPNGNSQLENQVKMIYNLPYTRNKTQYFIDFIYLTQIMQAECMKAQTEHYRRLRNEPGNNMGTLYWQLNDIWQAPSWASLEYKAKWKLLHYAVKRFYSPVLVSSYIQNNTVSIYIINDAMNSIVSSVYIYLVNWLDATKHLIHKVYLNSIAPYSASLIYQVLVNEIFSACNTLECFLYLSLNISGKTVSNYLFPLPVKYINLPEIKVTIASCKKNAISDTIIDITVQSTGIALYVWLETDHEGYFSDNGFIMVDTIYKMVYTGWGSVDSKDFCNTVTVRSLADVYNDSAVTYNGTVDSF